MFNTAKEVMDFCKKNEIRMIDFMMVDINGRWRHLTIPKARFGEDTLMSGLGFDGSNYGFAPVEKSDMVFLPDVTTAYVDPFAQVPTLAMLGDVYVIEYPDNRRFDQDPRNVAVHAEEYMKQMGIADEMRIGPEFEFHVFDHVDYSTEPHHMKYHVDLEEASWNMGNESLNLGYKIPHKGGYHMAPPMDRLSDLRSRMCLQLEDAGVKVKYHHHEVGGSGQLEIELEFGTMKDMADKTMISKYLIKNQAMMEGKSATFMPKPVYEDAGNGMHIHMQLFKKGKPVFFDEKGYAQLSQTALWFMGGILKHNRALCAFTNPSTNSYKRLVPGYEAPTTVGFAQANRSAVVRVPGYAKSPEKKRFELRSLDGTCNPYYAYAAVLMAGIDGIKKKIDPMKEGFGPYDFNLYDLSEKEREKIQFLPTSLDQALDALERDSQFLMAGGVFPEKLIHVWVANKRWEASRTGRMPHPVEFEMYYDL